MKKKKLIIASVIGILFIVLIIYYFSPLVFPSTLKIGEYTTSIVTRGSVMKEVDAEGTIAPQNEVLQRSPASSVVQRIVNSPGSHVKKGEAILVIDAKPIKDRIENLEDELEVKRNNLHKTDLNAKSTRLDLDYNAEMKKLKIASIQSELADQKQLLDVGGISPAKIEQTKQELVFAQKDLKMILQKNSIKLKQLEADEKGLQLEIEMKEKELQELKNILPQLIIKAPSAGIVLNVYVNDGDKISQGQLVTRISDLSSFKIDGKIDEKKADAVKTGREVFAIMDNEKLPGKIGNIQPVIQDNKVSFDVYLEESKHDKLMPNQKVNLHVVTERLDSVLRIRKGDGISDARVQNLFVVKDNRAVRTEVVTGLKGPEFIEILSGVKEGDVVITSDIASLRHLNEINIEQDNISRD